MTRSPVTCRPTTDLASCARKMWDGDFGFLPVVGERGEVVGVVTDRDLCMAVAMRDRRPGEIVVRDVMAKRVQTCSPDDDVAAVLRRMRDHQFRRLPVTDVDGVLRGVVSLADLALGVEEPAARAVHGSGMSGEDVLATLRAIARHRAPAEKA